MIDTSYDWLFLCIIKFTNDVCLQFLINISKNSGCPRILLYKKFTCLIFMIIFFDSMIYIMMNTYSLYINSKKLN